MARQFRIVAEAQCCLHWKPLPCVPALHSILPQPPAWKPYSGWGRWNRPVVPPAYTRSELPCTAAVWAAPLFPAGRAGRVGHAGDGWDPAGGRDVPPADAPAAGQCRTGRSTQIYGAGSLNTGTTDVVDPRPAPGVLSQMRPAGGRRVIVSPVIPWTDSIKANSSPQHVILNWAGHLR